MIYSLPELKNLAENYASKSKVGDVFFLEGDLGSGKTTFCRFFIQYFYPETLVTSPTFGCVNYYEDIAHYDLYKVFSMDELNLEEDFYNKICLIEWPEKIEANFQENIIKLKFEIASKRKRKVELKNI